MMPVLPNLLSFHPSLCAPSPFFSPPFFFCQVLLFLRLIYLYLCSSWLSSPSMAPSRWPSNFCQYGSMVSMCQNRPQTRMELDISGFPVHRLSLHGKLHPHMVNWMQPHRCFNIFPHSLCSWRMVATDEFGIKASMMLTMHNEGNCNNEERFIPK